MNNLLILLFLIVLSVSSTNAQQTGSASNAYQIYSTKYEGLKGAVWTVNYVETISGEVLSGHIRVYDTYGRLTDGLYYLNGTAPDAPRRPFYQYLKSTYSYDESGRLTKSTACDSKVSSCRKTIYTYDKGGRLLEEAEYESSGSIFNKYVYDHDTEKKLTKVTDYIFRDYDSKLIKNGVATYDANDNLIEWVVFLNENSVMKRETYTYDANRNLTEMSYCYDEASCYKEVFAYKFDSHGNWIEQRKTLKWTTKEGGHKSEPRTIIFRTITYYRDEVQSER
jgi:hypothetical protein